MNASETLDIFARVIWMPDDIVEVRIIHSVTRQSRTIGWYEASDLCWHTGELIERNRTGWNIFAGVNPRRDAQSGDAAVALCRCLFADFDHATVEQAQAAREAAGMPSPTVTINSGHGVHCYWRLAAMLTPAHWKEWQKDLAAALGSDPKICNPERLMRLPGFKNLKSEPHVDCSIVDCDPERIFDLADLPIPMRDGSDTPEPVFVVRRHVESAGGGNHVERCGKYIAKMPSAISGSGGHDATFAAACQCNRFGLTEAEALELMAWFNQSKCDPPWKPNELAHKVRSAYSKNQREHGDKLHDDRRGSRKSVFTIRRMQGVA